MAKERINSGKPWTPAEVNQLKDLANQNTPTRIVALKLGRTTLAVGRRAAAEGVSLKAVGHRPYNRQSKKP